METQTPLEKACEAVGGQSELARRISAATPDRPITAQGVQKWQKVPAQRVLIVEKVSGVPRTALRPDIYPVENGVLQ